MYTYIKRSDLALSINVIPELQSTRGSRNRELWARENGKVWCGEPLRLGIHVVSTRAKDGFSFGHRGNASVSAVSDSLVLEDKVLTADCRL